MAHELNGFTYEWIDGQANAARTLVLLHGTGGDEQSLLGLAEKLDASAAVLSPRGKVSENGMPRFFRRLAEGVFDLEDLKHRAHELADFLTTAPKQHGAAGKPLTGVGYSNGANIAASLLLLRPEVLDEAVLLRPMMPLEPEAIPDLKGTRVLILTGANDPIVPLEQARQLAGVLEGAGAEVEHHVGPAGHGLEADDLMLAVQWLQQAR